MNHISKQALVFRLAAEKARAGIDQSLNYYCEFMLMGDEDQAHFALDNAKYGVEAFGDAWRSMCRAMGDK